MVIAHEMAHMWFGDLVTMRWWNDVWLNESFVEYDYFARYRFASAALDDLLHCLAAASGADVRGWAERWLGTSGADTLAVRRPGPRAQDPVSAERSGPANHRGTGGRA
jgi:aminopeptidase N